MKELALKYYITFSDGDFGDDVEWDMEIPDDVYERIISVIEESEKDTVLINEGEYDFSCIDEKMHDYFDSIYDEIVSYETEQFLENEDPEDWGIEEDVEDSNWKITDSFDLTIRSILVR